MGKYQDLAKIHRIVDSCTTKEHLLIAKNILQRWCNKYGVHYYNTLFGIPYTDDEYWKAFAPYDTKWELIVGPPNY